MTRCSVIGEKNKWPGFAVAVLRTIEAILKILLTQSRMVCVSFEWCYAITVGFSPLRTVSPFTIALAMRSFFRKVAYQFALHSCHVTKMGKKGHFRFEKLLFFLITSLKTFLWYLKVVGFFFTFMRFMLLFLFVCYFKLCIRQNNGYHCNPGVDYFTITSCPKVFYSLHTTAVFQQFKLWVHLLLIN